MNLPEVVNAFNEHDKCKLCFAYFCNHYISYKDKKTTCEKCKHRQSCKNDEYEELKNFEPLIV